jgi:hypothetical protein
MGSDKRPCGTDGSSNIKMCANDADQKNARTIARKVLLGRSTLPFSEVALAVTWHSPLRLQPLTTDSKSKVSLLDLYGKTWSCLETIQGEEILDDKDWGRFGSLTKDPCMMCLGA